MTPQLQISHFSSYAPAATRRERFCLQAAVHGFHGFPMNQVILQVWISVMFWVSRFLYFSQSFSQAAGWTKSNGSDGTCQDLRCDIVGCSSTCLHASPCSWDVVFCQSSATITGHKSSRRWTKHFPRQRLTKHLETKDRLSMIWGKSVVHPCCVW